MKVKAVPSLDDENFKLQLNGVVDTVLNGSVFKNGDFCKVVNDRWAFSDINSHRKSAYGSVENVPISRVSNWMKIGAISHLQKRTNGEKSSVAGSMDYANPNYLNEATSSTRAWVVDVYEQAKKRDIFLVRVKRSMFME